MSKWKQPKAAATPAALDDGPKFTAPPLAFGLGRVQNGWLAYHQDEAGVITVLTPKRHGIHFGESKFLASGRVRKAMTVRFASVGSVAQ